MTNLAELFSLRDHVALVAGGYGGIGEAVCRAFANLGARVAIAGSKEASAKSLAAAIDPSGERTVGIGVDARDAGRVRRMTEIAAGRWGRLDVLVNCIGGNIREERASDVTEAGCVSTAARVVNVIDWVCRAPAGIIALEDIPPAEMVRGLMW